MYAKKAEGVGQCSRRRKKYYRTTFVLLLRNVTNATWQANTIQVQ